MHVALLPQPHAPLLFTTCVMMPCLPSLPLACRPLQNRMNKLESLRLEVDSRRRTVAKLGKKVGGAYAGREAAAS